MAESTVALIAAVFAALAAIASGIIAGAVAVATKQMEARHAKDLADHKDSLQKEIAAHQSRLHIQAETRLRLFERAATSVAEGIAALEQMRYTYLNFVYSNEEDLKRQHLLVEATRHVISSGVFVPPPLHQDFQRTRDYLVRDLKAAIYQPRSNTETRQAFDEVDKLLANLRVSAHAWIRAEWDRVTAGDLGMEHHGS